MAQDVYFSPFDMSNLITSFPPPPISRPEMPSQVERQRTFFINPNSVVVFLDSIEASHV